jgi:hypothetical protein
MQYIGLALACDKVAGVAGPCDFVLAATALGIGHLASAIGPEGVVVPSVRAGLGGGKGLALGELAGRSLNKVCRSGNYCRNSGSGQESKLGEEHGNVLEMIGCAEAQEVKVCLTETKNLLHRRAFEPLCILHHLQRRDIFTGLKPSSHVACKLDLRSTQSLLLRQVLLATA